MRYRWGVVIIFVFFAACSSAEPATTTSGVTVSEAVSTTAVPPTTSFTAPTSSVPQKPAPSTTTTIPVPDLTGELAWFAPLPPMPTSAGRPFICSDDFMDLFAPDAPWVHSIGHLQVFKLYGEWVAYHASDTQLKTAVTAIASMGLALAIEAGPLDATTDCGGGIEGFAGTDEGRLIGTRIQTAGGRIDAIALDEPYYYASIYDGPNACAWDAAKVAAEVGEYIDLMRSYFPDIIVGDTEPTPSPTDADTYMSWLETFRDVNGYDLAFLHLDIDWARSGWESDAKTVVEFGNTFGVPVGIIFAGNSADISDDRWLAIAGGAGQGVRSGCGASATPCVVPVVDGSPRQGVTRDHSVDIHQHGADLL